MGTTESFNKSFLIKDEQLNYYIDADDQLLGNVGIYTSKKMPLCFIMKIERDIEDSKIYNLFQRIQNAQINSLITLYGFKMDRHKYCNSLMKETVISYWEYYNFYFSFYLMKRSQKLCPFMQSEIWHIVLSCCEVYTILRKYNCFYDFTPQTMLVTPEGKLKFIWAHLKSQNKHLKYFKYFETDTFEPFYYSPEELQLITQKQLTNKLNFDKCGAFTIGILLLQCITLTNPLTTIYSNSTKINFKQIKNLIEQKVSPSYSQPVTQMLTQLLKQNPKDRLSIPKLFQKYRQYMSEDYQLRVCGGKKPQGKQIIEPFKQKASDISDAKTVKLHHSKKKK